MMLGSSLLAGRASRTISARSLKPSSNGGFSLSMLVYRRVVGRQLFLTGGGLQQAKNSNPSIGEETMLTGGCRKKFFGPPKIPGKQKSFQLHFGDPFWAVKTRRFSDFFKTESHGKPRVTSPKILQHARRQAYGQPGFPRAFRGRDPPKKKGRLSVKQCYCESQHLSLLLPRSI